MILAEIQNVMSFTRKKYKIAKMIWAASGYANGGGENIIQMQEREASIFGQGIQSVILGNYHCRRIVPERDSDPSTGSVSL